MKKRYSGSMFIIVLLAAFAANASTIAPTTELKDWPANPSRHTISIQRDAKTLRHLRMIELAEAAYTIKDKANNNASGPLIGDEKKWWYIESNVRIPWTITKEAIDYYTKLVESHKRKTWHNCSEPSSGFTYQSSAEFRKSYTGQDNTSFSNVFVVKMQIEFYLSNDWGIAFTKNREVIINADSKILKIYGDGTTEVTCLD